MLHIPSVSGRSTLQRIPAQGNGRRFVRRKEQILAAMGEVIDAGVTTGKYVQGPRVAALEQLIAKTWHVPAAIAVNSGTSALRLSLEALHLQAGGEVLVPALTFISTAYAISAAGLVPVFVDIDPQTLTLDPVAAHDAITTQTVAMVPVHLHGQMAEMLPLLHLADTYGLSVIEDCAQAHGATYCCDDHPAGDVWYAGSMGDLGCFSLSGVKNMGGLGDAGMVTVAARQVARQREVVDRLRALRDLGRVSTHRYVHDEWGWRARMDEFTATECLLECCELDRWNQRRRDIAARYSAALTHSIVQAPVIAAGRQHVFFNYVVKSPSTEVRDAFERHLVAAGIEVAESYTVLADQKPYQTGKLVCRVEPLPVARQLAPLCTHIPIYPELNEEEIERIEETLACDAGRCFAQS